MLSALYRDCAPHTYGTSVLPVLLCGRCCRRRHKGLCRRRASCRRRARSTTSRLRLPAGDAPRQGAAHKKSDRAGPVWRTGPPQTSVLIRYAALNFFYAGASVSGAIVLRSIMAHGPGRGGPGGVSGVWLCAKLVQKVYGSDRAHRSHSAHTHNYYKYVRSMCAQRNQHGNLNTRRGTSSDRWLHVDDITTQPGPHEPHPSRAPPWPEVGAKVQRVVGKVERQPAARLLRRQQPRLGRRAAHEACTVDGRGVSCGSQARETSLGRGQGSRMPPQSSADAERLRHPNGEGAGSGRAQRAALSKRARC